MLYHKNLPAQERALRLLAGAAMIGYGLVGLPAQVLGLLLAASGLGILLTGFLGFFPPCAMVGRKTVQSK